MIEPGLKKFMKNSTLEKSKKRVWEIDALRGLLMVCVLGTHLYYTVEAFCINGVYNIDPYNYVRISDPLRVWFDWGADGVIYKSFLTPELRGIWTNMGVDCFFVISGISYGFSRNNLKGGIRLLCAALFVSAFTKILVWYTGDESQFIRFGVLHCYAACHLIHYFLLEERSDKTILLAAVAAMVLGYYLRSQSIFTNSALLVPFGFFEHGAVVRDYWPVFPMLGWFLLGILIGKHRYREKETRFPRQECRKWHKPLRFLGRHSGLIYCGHIVLYPIVFYGIGHIFNLY